MIIVSVFFPSFLMHAAELGFNELDIQRTDTAGATRVRGGQGNGTKAKVSSTSEENICFAWVWRPNLGWHCDSTAGLQLPPAQRCFCGDPMGSAVAPMLLLAATGRPATLVGSYWVTTALHGCVAFGGGGR